MHTIHVCESHSRSISCPANHFILVQSAQYGRLSRQYCTQHSNIGNTNCRANSNQVLHIVQRWCHNRRSCTVYSGNAHFGDPCSGIFKYLQVKYTCEADGRYSFSVLHIFCGRLLQSPKISSEKPESCQNLS